MFTIVIQVGVIFIAVFIVIFIASVFILDMLGFKKGVGAGLLVSFTVAAFVSYFYVVDYLPWSCSNYQEAYEASDSKYDYMTNRCLIQDPSNGKFVTPNNYGRAN